MADSLLKDRLRDHSEAFDSLLSLIPAKLYYGEDTSNQWKRKKQTKEQARAAKRSKLDPDSALNRNAKEVLDERVRNKRKAQELEPSEDGTVNDEDDDEVDDAQELQLRGISKETPGEGLKKRRVVDDEAHEKSNTAQPMAGDEAKRQNLSTHQEKKRLKKQKKAEKNAEKEKTKMAKAIGMSGPVKDSHAAPGNEEEPTTPVDILQSKDTADGGDTKSQKTMRPIDVSGLVDDDADHTSSQASTPSSPTFDTAEPGSAFAEPASTTTSIASENAPADKSRKIKVPSDTTELRARLAAKIAALRAARKADGPDGTPIRTREELIELRRKKLAERKAHKKELRQKAKEAEDKKREEALASARNSPMLGFGSGSPEHESFSFGRVAFADGTQMSHDLSYTKDNNGKKKGPIDPKGALAKVEAQKKRLAGLDDAKRKEVLEKEAWLAARRKAEGEKVHNNESLLKKAVKRKEKAKKKSENEWSDRVQGVQKAQKQRQQKREENIRKRKETKQAGKGGKKKGGGKPSAKKSRPGFEGGVFGRRK